MTLKDARRITGLSQNKLTDLYGIPRRTFQAWELGARECPKWCERLVIKELLNYKGDGNMTLYSVISTSTNNNCADEFEHYLGFDYDEAIKAYNEAKNGPNEPSVECRVYRIPADTDKRDKDEIINAMCDCIGYDLLEV